MTEEPYRWLEAIGNRREYVEGQLKGGSPVFGFSRPEGVLLLGVGSGNSKVFEIFDRQAIAGLGHPADLERIRQSLIDAAHLEAFTRAPADVTLRRLVSFGLSPQLKTAFEQIFSPPFLVRLLLAEVSASADTDVLLTVDFDGTFRIQSGGLAVVADDPETAHQAERWLTERITSESGVADVVGLALEAWRHMTAGQPLPEAEPDAEATKAAISGKTVEAALLQRSGTSAVRYQPLDPRQLGLPDPSTP